MTAVARRIRGADVMPLPNNRAAIAGPLATVSALLDRLRADGQLVDATNPQPTGEPGIVMVTARLVPAALPRQGQPRRRPRKLRIALLAVAAAVLAGIAWGIALAVSWVVAHVALVIAFVLVVSLISGGITSHYCTTTVKVTHRH